MTANPFAALLDGKFQEHATMHRDAGDMNGYRAILGVASAVYESLSAAVPADLAEAGKLADECYEAVSGEGPRAFDWTDKPHRLVYDMYGTIRSLTALATAQAAQIEGLEKERDEIATANHRQAFCIHLTAANLGPDCSATVDGLPKAARHVASERDALLGAIKGLVEVLDQHETKGPLPDTALMFCWLAAQNVRAVLRGYMLEKPE